MRIKRFTTKEDFRTKRHSRVRAKVRGTALCPRLSVFKSNKHVFAQLIDDVSAKTLVSASDSEIKLTKKDETGFAKMARSKAVGELVAEKALANKIDKVVFDRGGYRYTGRVKEVAEGARAGGLKF